VMRITFGLKIHGIRCPRLVSDVDLVLVALLASKDEGNIHSMTIHILTIHVKDIFLCLRGW
jgi:hypothetical protein